MRTLCAVALPLLVMVGLLGCSKKSKVEVDLADDQPTAARSTPATSVAVTASNVASAAPAPQPTRATPVVLARGQSHPIAVAVVNGEVFWANNGVDENDKQQLGLGSIAKVPVAGGDPVVVAAKQNMPGLLVADSKYLYWTDLNGVRRAPLAGGPVAVVAAIQKGRGMPFSLAEQGDTVYLGTLHVSDAGLYRVKKTGGALGDVNTGFSVVNAVATDSKYVYLCINGDVLGRIPHGGGAMDAAVLAKGVKKCSGLGVDADGVYFTEADAGAVKKVAKTGGPATIIASGLRDPNEIVVDGTSVYWLEQGGGRISRASTTGGAVVVLAENLRDPRGLAIAQDYAFWTEPAAGTVSKVPTNGTSATAVANAPVEATPKAEPSAAANPDCHPCATQEDFDVAYQKRKKCCPVEACKGDSDCTGSRVCCNIPIYKPGRYGALGTLCTDERRCASGDRVR